MKSTSQIRNELAVVVAKAEALAELAKQENRDFTPEETTEIDAIATEQKTLNSALDTAIKFEAILATKMPAEQIDKRKKPEGDTRLTIPLAFKSEFRPGMFPTAEAAYNSGQWARAAIFGNKKSAAYCKENGIPLVRNAMGTGDNTKGGFLVPNELAAAIIERREQFGIFARDAARWVMGSPNETVPRVIGDVTSYWGSENTALTASDMSIGGIVLVAKKLTAMVVLSDEVNEDSIISLAEIIARSVAYKFAYDEDNAGFNGDGTSTYGGISGCAGAILAGSIATATSHTSISALTMADFESAVGKLKQYPGIQPRWYFHQNVWANGPQRLLDALGGNNNQNVAQGSGLMFKGYPVTISQVLLSGAGTTGQIYGYFGDLGLTAYYGTRRGMTMRSSDQVYFNLDQIAIKATERLDINVYDVGTSTDSGGIIQLKLG